LIWVTRLPDTSSTVTGMESPSPVKMRIMPTLRPTRPRLIVLSDPGCDWPGDDARAPPSGRRPGKDEDHSIWREAAQRTTPTPDPVWLDAQHDARAASPDHSAIFARRAEGRREKGEG